MAAPEATLAAPVTDEALVACVTGGDEAAFQEIYDRYFRRVYHFLDKRLRNRADTEECTQEVFINLFNSLESFRGEAPFAAWVFGLTRRTLAGRFKKKRHPTVPLHDDEGEPSHHAAAVAAADTDPLAAYECQERMQRMEEALLQELTDEQRQLFRLHHLQHRSIQEIAGVVAKSEDAVKSNLYRARKVLLAR